MYLKFWFPAPVRMLKVTSVCVSEGGERFRMRLGDMEEAPEDGIDGLMEARGGDTAQLVMSLLRKHEDLSWNLRSLTETQALGS